MKKLDINKLLKEKQVLKIGELTSDVIQLLNLNEKPRNIKIGYDRISHCDRHKKDFKNELSYTQSMEQIPQIIDKPDYVGYNNKNNGIEYIKRLDDLTLVAIRLKPKGDLFLRSVYPISEIKLRNGILSNEIKEIL